MIRNPRHIALWTTFEARAHETSFIPCDETKKKILRNDTLKSFFKQAGSKKTRRYCVDLGQWKEHLFIIRYTRICDIISQGSEITRVL